MTTSFGASTSFYPQRPDDAAAVTVTAAALGAHADGVGDDTVALQAAIDRVQETMRRGLVFLPTGRYRVTKTLRVWSGIRLIGYGATRPVLVLGEHTPGFQEGSGKYLVHFVSDRPQAPDQPVRDANPGTFYSAMSNIDIEIQPGNPAAVGVRSHYAQHGFLAHMAFHIGEGRAGVEEVGNLSEDLQFFGGEFGITMHKPSPSWPFALLDSAFEGQRRAAIETEEGGLTLVRVQARNVPTVVLVRAERSEELWAKDCRFEHVRGPALVISEEKSARTQINLQNVMCVDVPVLAQFRESGREIVGPGAIYQVKEFSHGLQIADPATAPEIKTIFDMTALAAAPAPVATDVPGLPPMETWVNLRALGAKGDGVADDTAVLREAIAKHRTIYLPSGRYRVTGTIGLRPDTVLLGLNPITTQIMITDFTPAFQGVNGPVAAPEPPQIPGVPRSWLAIPPFAGRGAPVPLLETPRGGTNVVSGLGLDTGGVNNRAVALWWRAGEHSLVDDVRFLGGHGTYGPDGQWLPIYNENHTADPDPLRRWDSQFASLWVADGGGGVFKNIWTPSPFAAAGLEVTNTSTPGRVYALSSEHHVRNEVKLRKVANWAFFALQTEEERGEGPHALPLELEGCENVTIANFFAYRVDTPEPFSTAIRVSHSQGIGVRGVHVYSPGKLSFDNTLVDVTRGVEVRPREIAWLQVAGERTKTKEVRTKMEAVATGFKAIDGLAVDARGRVSFVDQSSQRIYRWSEDEGLTLITDAIPQPAALAIDAAGNLMIVSRHGNVYTLPPGGSDAEIVVLTPEKAAARPGATVWLPVNRWRDSHDWIAASTRREPWQYRSPDGTVVIPAPEAYTVLPKPGAAWRFGTIDLARTYALAAARTGEPFYASDEFGQTTWRFEVTADGTLAAPARFAEEGEAGTAVDAEGNVYVCAGNVFVYDRTGRQIDVIDVPERPSAVALGGKERRMLLIAARSSLYAVPARAAAP